MSFLTVRGEVGEVLSCSSSSSKLMTTGVSYGLKGVASLILFLGLGLASSFLTLLSFCCLEEGEVQGPDIRPKALGLWPLFGLGDQLLLLLQPCLPAVLLRLIPLWVFCWVNLLEFVLGHLVGGVVFVPRLPPGGGSPGVQVDCRVASWCLDIHLRVDCVLGHPDCHQYISSACPSPRGRNFWSLDSWRSC